MHLERKLYEHSHIIMVLLSNLNLIFIIFFIAYHIQDIIVDLDNEENSFHKDDGRHIVFAKFCQELNRDFPDDELNSLKELIIGKAYYFCCKSNSGFTCYNLMIAIYSSQYSF